MCIYIHIYIYTYKYMYTYIHMRIHCIFRHASAILSMNVCCGIMVS